jgi:hypothetical protein
MAFKPKSNGNGGNYSGVARNFPVPKAGNRPARVSLIVDLGIQTREDFEDPVTKQTKPQKPAHQIAIFADLTSDVVDYGGDIGKQPYRLMLNRSFKGVLEGTNFNAVQPRDAEGNAITGKKWTYHPQSLLTKLAKATGIDAILNPKTDDDLDIEQLLGKALMIGVDVNEKDSGKKDDAGKPIVYRNVNATGYSSVPFFEDVDGNEVQATVKPLAIEPLVITFDNVTAETVKFIRADVRRKIQLATNYEGSQMQKVLAQVAGNQASNEKQEGADAGGQQDPAKEPEAPAKPAPKRQRSKPAEQESVGNSEDNELPF